jgi:hypothetical protein
MNPTERSQRGVGSPRGTAVQRSASRGTTAAHMRSALPEIAKCALAISADLWTES